MVVAAPEGHTLAEQTYSKAVDALITDLADAPAGARRRAWPTRPRRRPAAETMVDQAVEGGTPKADAEANARALLPLSEDGRVGTMSFQFDVDTPTDIEARRPSTRSRTRWPRPATPA